MVDVASWDSAGIFGTKKTTKKNSEKARRLTNTRAEMARFLCRLAISRSNPKAAPCISRIANDNRRIPNVNPSRNIRRISGANRMEKRRTSVIPIRLD
jgi:hypothetical protein